MIGQQDLQLLPRGRDFTSVVTQAAGAANEAFLGGISIDGASGSENRFVIDGVDTTHPQDGVSGQSIITDFVEEVQVKTAGYTAEFGGSLGGVINAVTKTGGRDFTGSILGYYNDSNWNGAQRKSSYESNCGTAQDCLITYKKDKVTRFEPGFSLGGPIFRDNLWFFVAYQPSTLKTERTPLYNETGSGPATKSYKQTVTDEFLTANIKGSIGSSFFYKFALNYGPSKTEKVLPAQDVQPDASVPLGITTKNPSESYSLYADYVAGSNFLASARVGYWLDDTKASGNFPDTRFFFRNGTIPVATTDPRYHPAGWSSVPNASFQDAQMDKWQRYSAGLDSTVFLEGLGSHEVKLGVQYELIKNKVNIGEAGNLFEIRWGLSDRFGAGVIGEYGSLHVRDFRTDGAAESTNWSLFLQDSWVIGKNLTVNYGVRTEQERVPNYGAKRDPTLPKNAISFDFKDKIAPRLGFAWDVLGDAKLKVFGSYGNYYDITKLEMPRGSFGADKWIAYLYPINTLDWASLATGCHKANNTMADNPCPNLGVPVRRDLRAPTDPRENIDPNLKPMENLEYQLGVDYQVLSTGVVGLHYVNKKLLNTIEDIGYLVCSSPTSCEEVYTTGNPGKGLVVKDYVKGVVPPQAKAYRDYQAVELSYTRRFADNWSLRATYTYSELTGNYSGLASSDEFGRTDPNVARYFDGLVYGYNSKGKLAKGVLNTDRPNDIRLSGLYRFNFGTSVGVNTSWRTGSPVSQDEQLNGVNFFPYGRNNLGRLDSITQTDLFIAHPFKIGTFGGRKLNLEVNLNVSNLFDEKKVTQVDNAKWNEDLCTAIEQNGGDCSYDYYFRHVVPYNFDTYMKNAFSEIDPDTGKPVWEGMLNPTFMKPLAYQAPRTIRLGVKLTF